MTVPSRRSLHRRLGLLGLVVVTVGTGSAAAVITTSPHSTPHPAAALVNRPVPDLPLVDEHGRTTSLAAYRGTVVVLSPFLTLCHEVCPLTTGALMQMRRAVAAAGLGHDVAFVEVSVDPWRDTAARLRAFKRLTKTHIALRTGTAAELTHFWSVFGVAFWRTPEGKVADRDWLTSKPLRFDVSHTDGLFLIDARGHWRLVDLGMPSLGGHIAGALLRLLDDEGRRNLDHPQAPWTVRQGLDDIGYLIGRRIPDLTTDR